MIEILKGEVLDKSPTKAVILCAGVGYGVNITLSLFDNLQIGGVSVIPVRAIYRETEQLLFGFVDNHQRSIFDKLLKVSGIGPKTAMGIVSGMNSAELAEKISKGDIAALSKLPGIGRKTAERMALELAGKLDLDSTGVSSSDSENNIVHIEAVAALVSLGFAKAAAEKAVKSTLKDLSDKATVEDVIRTSLRNSMA